MKNRFKISSVRGRAFLAIAVLALLSLLIGGLITSLVVEREITGNYEVAKNTTIEGLSYALEPILESADYAQVERLITAILKHRYIASIAVYDINGILISSVEEEAAASATVNLETYTISGEGGLVGSMAVGIYTGYISDQVRSTVLALIAGLAVIFIIGGFLFFELFNRFVSRPLAYLNKKVTEMAPENLMVRLEQTGDDEFGALARNINEMAERLQEYDTSRREAEEMVRQSEERLRIVFEYAPDAYYLNDLEGNFINGNKAAERLSGYAKEELIGKSFLKLNMLLPQDVQRAAELLIKNANGQSTGPDEFSLIQKDGSQVIVEISTFPVEVHGQALVLAIARDITERKKAEEALRESEAKYRNLTENLDEVIYRADPETFVASVVNTAIEGLYGYTVEEWLKDPALWENSIHPDDKERVLGEIAEAQMKKEPCTLEYRIVRKDKTMRWVRDHVSWENDQQGNPVSINGAMYDITERKHAEKTLKQSEERYRTILEEMEDSYFEVDLGGHLTFVNNAVCRHLGYTREELIGMSYKNFTPEDDVESVFRVFNEVYRTGEPNKGFPWKVIRKDGTEGFAEATVSPLRNDKGEIIGFRGVGRDVTERRKMVEQLIVTDRLASIGELASGIAHELNNPLTGIIGFSQLLVERNVPEDIKEDLKVVNSEAQRAANVVKGLLTFARKHPPLRQLINVNDVISKVLELRAYEQKVSNIETVINLAPDLPVIAADFFQLQQVFLNIVTNAEYFMLKAHNKGTLTITTERVEDIVRISFADDGPGISQKDLGHVFDPFFTTKEVGQGTGLGLSISHGIVTAHGGRIYAKSGQRKGATFVVELPIGQRE
jgi:two-component system NtrC family sensor kinase